MRPTLEKVCCASPHPGMDVGLGNKALVSCVSGNTLSLRLTFDALMW